MMAKARKRALITGVTGQDGALLAEFLLHKGYEVHGCKRRASSLNTERVDHLYADRHERARPFFLHYADMTDAINVTRVVQDVQPNEIYNLAAQSHVAVSFETAEYTANADALGALRLLEAMRTLKLGGTTRFYQASTSEMFGAAPPPQNERSPFLPRSPYAAAKLYAYWMTVNYRATYQLHACNGILFNHESPLRGETFVSRKITRAVGRIKHGSSETLYLGNLAAERDWGHARDFVQGMWQILQHKTPQDFVLATGRSHSVRAFAERAFAEIGIQLVWTGQGVKEEGRDAANGRVLIKIDPAYFRPAEVDSLRGDAKKARSLLGWKPRTDFAALVREMVRADVALAAREKTRRA